MACISIGTNLRKFIIPALEIYKVPYKWKYTKVQMEILAESRGENLGGYKVYLNFLISGTYRL